MLVFFFCFLYQKEKEVKQPTSYFSSKNVAVKAGITSKRDSDQSFTKICQQSGRSPRLTIRFDALIALCRQFHFCFREVGKDDFLTCIVFLPRYDDKIRALSFSEWHTPGEINIFLSSFPSFDQLKYLRMLHFISMPTPQTTIE